MKNKLTGIIALSVILTVAIACEYSATTANLSDIKFGKDKSAGDQQTTFAPDDTIFAVTALNNTSSTHKVKFRLLFDDVEGAEAGSVAYGLEKDFEIEGSRDFWYSFSVPDRGFVPGQYKAEFVLMDGEKSIDTKTADFTVKANGKSVDGN